MYRKIVAHCIRTKMCLGSTTYDVYVPTRQKGYEPITNLCYATVIIWQGERYYRLADFLRTPTMDGLPPFSEERSDAFKRIEKLAKRLEAKLAARVYPELAGHKALPWLSETLDHDTREVSFWLHEEYLS